MADIAYRMAWTQTGLEETVSKSKGEVEKLSTATANLISRLERKASVSDMGADAFALAQAKASGASQATLDYISALQQVVAKTKSVREEIDAAAVSQAKMDKDRRAHVAARRDAVPDNEELRQQYEYKSKPQREASDRAREMAEKEAYRKSVADRSRLTTDNETLRKESETKRLSAGQRELISISEQLARTTRELRSEEIAAIETRMRLAGATEAQQAAARGMISAHNPAVDSPLRRIKYDPSRAGGGSGGGGAGARVGLELSRAIEDSIAGGAYGGIKGAIMGASNNISQAGAMLGPQAALIASVTSTLAILGVTAWTAYDKWREGAENAKKSLENLQLAQGNQLQQLQEEISLRQELQSLDSTRGKASAEQAVQNKTAALEDVKAEQALKQQQVKNMLMRVGFTEKNTVQDLQDAAADPTMQWARPGGGFGEGPLDLKHKFMTPEYVTRAIQLQQEANAMGSKVTRAEKLLDKSKSVLERESIAEQGLEMESALASRKSTKEQDAADREARKERRKKQQDSLANVRLSVMPDDTSEDRLRKQAAQLELEKRDRDQKINEAKKAGLITTEQADSMLSQSQWKRTFDNVELRKKSSEDGGRGQSAQALDIKSSEGMAQLLRALNANRDDIGREQLDVQRQIEQGIRDGNSIKPIDLKEVHWS